MSALGACDSSSQNWCHYSCAVTVCALRSSGGLKASLCTSALLTCCLMLQLHYNKVNLDHVKGGKSVANPVGEIMVVPRPISLLQGVPRTHLDALEASPSAGSGSSRKSRKDAVSDSGEQDGDSIAAFERWVEEDLLSFRHHKDTPLASALEVSRNARVKGGGGGSNGRAGGNPGIWGNPKVQQMIMQQDAPGAAAAAAHGGAKVDKHSSSHGTASAANAGRSQAAGRDKSSFSTLVKDYETNLKAEEWSSSRALEKRESLTQNLAARKGKALDWPDRQTLRWPSPAASSAVAVEEDGAAEGAAEETAGAVQRAPEVMKHHAEWVPLEEKRKKRETAGEDESAAMTWPETVSGPFRRQAADSFFSMGRGPPFKARPATYGVPGWRPTGQFDQQKMAAWMRGGGARQPKGQYGGAGEDKRSFKVMEGGSALFPEAPGLAPMTPLQRNQAGLRQVAGEASVGAGARWQTLRLQPRRPFAGQARQGLGEIRGEHAHRGRARGRGRRNVARGAHAPRYTALPADFYAKPSAASANRKDHEDWLGLSTDVDPANLIDTQALEPQQEPQVRAGSEGSAGGSRARKGLSPEAFPKGFRRQVVAEERRLEQQGSGIGAGADAHAATAHTVSRHVPGARTTSDLDDFDKMVFGGTSLFGDADAQVGGAAGDSKAPANSRPHGLPGIHLWYVSACIHECVVCVLCDVH